MATSLQRLLVAFLEGHDREAAATVNLKTSVLFRISNAF